MSIRILILAANPKDTTKLRLDEELREIEAGLERSRFRDEFTIKSVLAPRTRDVRRAMLDFRPTIVHFCGHGRGADGIALVSEQGETRLVRGEVLAGFFELFADKVQHIILNACYTEEQAEHIAKHISCVIGMRKGISDKAAIDFAVAFYDAIGAGRNARFAYQLACNALMWDEASSSSASVPVLKLRESDSDEQQLGLEESSVAFEEEATPSDSGAYPEAESSSTLRSSVAPLIDTALAEESQEVHNTSEGEAHSSSQAMLLAEGFAVSLAAAFFWGVGNAATTWSTNRFPLATFDITLLKYSCAGGMLVVSGLVYRFLVGAGGPYLPNAAYMRSREYYLSAIAKGASMYCWLLATVYSTASLTAAFENMHVFWTALILSYFLGVSLPRNWLSLCLVVFLGTFLIAGAASEGTSGTVSTPGVALGLLSGLGFSIFSVLWSTRPNPPQHTWERAIEMGTVLLVSAAIIYPLHLVVNEIWLQGPRTLFADISRVDIGIQGINGVIGIGITYLLIGESMFRLAKVSPRASLFVGLGLSFVVPITAVSEYVFLNINMTLLQAMGVCLYVVGYSILRGGLVPLESLGRPESSNGS